jgi:predicted ATPase
LLERPDSLPLVCRQTELAELLHYVETATKGKGGLILVYGEAGVGKTRLLREVARNAQWRGLQTAWGHCYELDTSPAYQPLVEALRASLPALSELTLEPLWRGELSRLLPELAVGDDLPPALLPEEERRRLLEAITLAFLALAEANPHLILLEDVHWMDPASLEALRYLLPRLAGSALLVIASIRTEELVGMTAAALSALEDTRLPQHLKLEPLDLEGTGELVHRALGLDRPAPRFSARLYAETEGNPFFLIETLLALMEEGLLYRDEAGGWSTPWDEFTEDYAELPLPAGVVQSIQRRLDRLPDSLSEVLNLAAVIGRGVDFEVWRTASGQEEETLLMAGDELCARGLFLVVDSDPTSGVGERVDYVFSHEQIRRVAYERLAPPRRRSYHRRVAQAFAHLVPSRPELLAHHWTQAEEWDEAALYHQQAGDRARQVYANAEAVTHYDRALECLEQLPEPIDPQMRYQLYVARAEVHHLQGEREEQAKDLKALVELAETLDDDPRQVSKRRAEVALQQASYAEAIGEYPEAIETVQEAFRWAQAAEDRELEAASHWQWGRTLWRRGDYKEARLRLEQALAQARSAGLRQMEADSLRNLGIVCWYSVDYSKAKAYYEQSLPISRELGDRRGEGAALNGLGLIHLNQGKYTEAGDYYEQSRQICAEIGDRRGEGMALNNLGQVSRRRGDYALAKGYYEQALQVSQEIGDRWNEGQVLTNLGVSAYYQGDYGEARSFFEQVSIIWQGIGNRQGEGGALANLGCVSRRLGEYTKARPILEKALRIFQDVGDRKTEGVVLCDLSLLYHHLGDDRAAEECGQGALAIAQDLGDSPAQGNALTNLARAQMGLGRLNEAATSFRRALDLRTEIGELHLAMESTAGLARVSLKENDIALALSHVEEILAFLETGMLAGTEEPLWIFMACYLALRANQDPRAEDVLTTSHNLLCEQATKIEDSELRRSYLENVVFHREIVAAYQELKSQQQRGQAGPEGSQSITVSLPRVDAPLGRPLRENEYVSVTWTVAVPKDEAIAGKVARRQHRILRLLNEAQAQGAAPTLEHLAEALGVSRRTIERDVALLRSQEQTAIPPTRGKMSH